MLRYVLFGRFTLAVVPLAGVLLVSLAGCGGASDDGNVPNASRSEDLSDSEEIVKAPPPPPPPPPPAPGVKVATTNGTTSERPSSVADVPASPPGAPQPPVSEAINLRLNGLGNLSAFFVTADGTRLVTCAGWTGRGQPPNAPEGTPFVLWDLATTKPLRAFGTKGDTATAMSRGGEYMLLRPKAEDSIIIRPSDSRYYAMGSHSQQQEVSRTLLEVATGKRHEFRFQTVFVRARDFAHDAKKLVLAINQAKDKEALVIVDTASGKMQVTPLSNPMPISSAACSPTEGTLAVGRNDVGRVGNQGASVIELYDLQTLQIKKTLPQKGPPYDLAYSGDGRTLAVVRGDQTPPSTLSGKSIDFWDTTTWQSRVHVEQDGTHGPEFMKLAFSHDGGLLAAQPAMHLWDVRSGKYFQRSAQGCKLSRPYFLPNNLLAVGMGRGLEFYDPLTWIPHFPPYR